MIHLSDDEVDELDKFLMSDIVSHETMMIDTLDGFLTAIAIGPTTVLPSEWLPAVWGPTPEDTPQFESMDQAQHGFSFLMRHYNRIIPTLEHDPDSIAPLPNINHYPDDPHEYFDGEAWAHGLMDGVGLRRADWQPLLDDAQEKAWLRPIYPFWARKKCARTTNRSYAGPSSVSSFRSRSPTASRRSIVSGCRTAAPCMSDNLRRRSSGRPTKRRPQRSLPVRQREEIQEVLWGGQRSALTSSLAPTDREVPRRWWSLLLRALPKPPSIERNQVAIRLQGAVEMRDIISGRL